MPEIETYIASGGQGAVVEPSLMLADAVAPGPARYEIHVRFLGGLSATQKAAFKAAADRWTGVITGALPRVRVDNELIDGLVITAQGRNIDGPGRILGQAGPTRLRPGGIGAGANLPAMGEMMFDSADLAQMQAQGTLNDVIAHEMGHVIGIGTIWGELDLISGAGTSNPRFKGANANREFNLLSGGASQSVPIENTGGPGTADGHWRDAVFGNELMTGFVADPGNPLSAMTIASLQDMGYVVDMAKAEPYQLPDLTHLAALGVLTPNQAEDHLLGTIPMILPPESLV